MNETEHLCKSKCFRIEVNLLEQFSDAKLFSINNFPVKNIVPVNNTTILKNT